MQLRQVAVFLSLTLFWPHLSWAFEPDLWAKPKNLPQPWGGFSLPFPLAKITQPVTAAQPRLIYIQDLHCQYETQVKIAELLEYLFRTYGISRILIEGASQPVNVTKLSTFPLPAVRQAAGEYLLRLGKMSGAEYFAATAGHAISLEGIEQANLYQAERDCLKRFYTYESLALSGELRDELIKLKAEIYSPALAALDHFRTGFSSGSLSPLQYGRLLKICAQNLRQPLWPFPELNQYLDENQAEPAKSLDLETIAQQLLAWDKQLQEKTPQTQAERDLYETCRRFGQIEACLGLAATSADITEIRLHPHDYLLSEFNNFLARHGRPQELRDLQTLENFFKAAKDFYDLADQRSLAFAQKTREALQSHPDATLVLIAGGYHADVLLQTFQKNGLTCCAVKMRQGAWQSENPYAHLLRQPHCLLEKIIAPLPSSALALPPFCEQTPHPAQILEEKSLCAEVAQNYTFLEGLLKSLAAADLFSSRSPSLKNLHQEYTQWLRNYPAEAKQLDLDFEHSRTFSQALIIPLGADGPAWNRPFALIYPKASRLALPSPVSLLTIRGNRLAFYPGAMRTGVEKILPVAEGRTTILPFLTELLNDLKLAAGLIPLLQRLSTTPPSWFCTTLSFAGLLVLLGASATLSNWLLAQKQNRTFNWRELRLAAGREWRDYKQVWVRAFRDFWSNRSFQPKSSWFAVALLVAARGFDYGTQLIGLSRLSIILTYSGFGLLMIFSGMLALRFKRKTAWFADIINQSLRVAGAVVVIQVLKLPFAFALVAFGASQVFAERLNDAFLKWLKKVIGILSFADLFTSLRTWIINGRPKNSPAPKASIPNRAQPPSWLPGPFLQRCWAVFNPRSAIAQLLLLFIFANILFMNFYFAIPLQLLLVLQLGIGALLLINWLFIFKNVQISQKVKLISLTGILPAALISVMQATLVILSLLSAIFAQYVPAGLAQALLNFKIPVHLEELAGFVAMMYSLLGFSNIMKDQTKFDQASAPAEERRAVVQKLILGRLQQAAPQLSGLLTEAEIQALQQPVKIRLFSNNGQPEWLKEFFRSGLHVYKENIYLRRRIFNLLNDQTVADLIFQKILKRKLSPEIAESVGCAITGRNPQEDETLLKKILSGGSAQEMSLALTLMNNHQKATLPLQHKSGLQRAALEKRFKLKFPVADGAYLREFSGTWGLLNQKMKIIQHFQIPPHPFFLRLSAERLQKLGRCLETSHRREISDYALCRKIIETGELDAQAGFFFKWCLRLTPSLPPLFRKRLELFWFKTQPTAYLYSLTAHDPSPLAVCLRDRRSPAAKAFAAWAGAPNPVSTREWINQMLSDSQRTALTEKEKLASALTFSRLSRQLAILEGSPCGTWLQGTYARQYFWAPLFLTQPGFEGLRGALLNLLSPLPIKTELKVPKTPRHGLREMLARMV